tara:strand:- start:141 stop:653 length:513 start_codon:yes stop_codon:yes gene_type:complete
MSLVSTVPAETAASALNPILYDSGWKTVTGNSAFTDLENLTFDTDGMVHIYAKMWRQTNLSYYLIEGPYTSTNANAAGTFTPSWRTMTNKSKHTATTIPPFTVYQASSEPSSFTSGMAVDSRSCQGYPLEKNTSFVFQQNSSASTSYGIQYRIVVERSDGDHMVKWATNA